MNQSPNNESRERRGRKPRRPRGREDGFASKVINIRRVARVVAGGRRFSFSVVMVMGDKSGRVGVGVGKAGDTSEAINKATRDAKKNMTNVPLTDSKSISHEVAHKYSSAIVAIRPAPGHGLIAGSAARAVLGLLGARDVNAKVLSRSKNKLNIARATLGALLKLKKQPSK